MSVALDRRLKNVGTKFRIFPQPRFLQGVSEPELIWVSVPPSAIEPGPADNRMFVVDAVNKLPYSQSYGPPYTGERNEPLKPGPGGHFDHLDPNNREFLCATMYATVRRVLDIWEDYFGRQIEWHFEAHFPRLELLPLVEWNNAQSGYGFLEFGYGYTPSGGIDYQRPYCDNFDVLAHELGHCIILSQVGVPSNPGDEATDYRGLHESAGDLVAIVSALHSPSTLRRLLENTSGNLFTVNELDRVGELDQSREVRIAFNNKTMSDVGNEPHDRLLPLTGALFDVMVEVFQKTLVRDNLITKELAALSTQEIGRGQSLSGIQLQFDNAYQGNGEGFTTALLEARDYLGALLARTWSMLRPPNFLTYHDVLTAVMQADRVMTAGAHQQTIRECFVWRQIGLAPESILRRPRLLSACGLAATRPNNGLAAYSDEALSEAICIAKRELENRRTDVLKLKPTSG